MELILLAATAAAGGGALAAACWRSAHGACVGLGLAAAGVAVIAALHDAFTAAAVLLVQAAVGLTAASSPAAPAVGGASPLPRLLAATVVAGLGVVLAMALAAALAVGPPPPSEPPRSGVLVLVLGALLLLSAVVGVGALFRPPDSGGEAS